MVVRKHMWRGDLSAARLASVRLVLAAQASTYIIVTRARVMVGE